MGASSDAGRMGGQRLCATRAGYVEFIGQLLVGRFAAQLLLQAHPMRASWKFVHEMHRQADGLGLVGEGRLMDCLIHHEP